MNDEMYPLEEAELYINKQTIFRQLSTANKIYIANKMGHSLYSPEDDIFDGLDFLELIFP